MDTDAVARALGLTINAVAAAALAASGLALLAGGREDAWSFLFTAILSGFAGMSLYLASRRGDSGAPRRSGGAREALMLSLLGWSIAPAFAALAFWGEGRSGSFATAYADAVSAATTTGLRPAFLEAGSNDALVYWWCFIQWAGGFASIVTALVVLAALNLTGPGVHRSALFTLEPDRLFDRFAPVGGKALGLYVTVSLVCALALALTGLGYAEALCAAAAAVSTGGLLLPDGEMSAAGLSGGALLVLSVGLAFGALNFSLHWDVSRGRALRPWYIADGETRAALALVGVAVALVWIAGGASDGGWGRAAFEAVALAATAGWETGAVGTAALGAPIVLALALIGGSPVSTAGGVKVVRLVLLLRHSAAELRQLAHPSSVAELRYRDRVLADSQIMGLLLYVIGFALAVTVLTLALTMGGAPFDAAFAGAVAATANTGPVITVVGGADAEAALSTTWNRMVMCIGMILGRVEVLAALAVTTRGFWSR